MTHMLTGIVTSRDFSFGRLGIRTSLRSNGPKKPLVVQYRPLTCASAGDSRVNTMASSAATIPSLFMADLLYGEGPNTTRTRPLDGGRTIARGLRNCQVRRPPALLRPPRAASALLDGDRVDDGLYGARDAPRAEREQELPRLVLHHFLGVHVLEDVDAVHRQQDLVHLEHALVLLERHHLEPPGVGADRHHAESGEVSRALHAEPGLTVVVALVVLADQLRPPGVEEHHVAFLDGVDPLLLHRTLDLGAVEGRAFLHGVLPEVT